MKPTVAGIAAVAADLVCVFAFAFAGKSSHEAGDSSWVVLAIVWPFALSVLLAHAGVVVRRGRAARVWPEGVAVVLVTYGAGMLLRVLSGRGIAVAFLLVAALFLALTMLGWRSIVRLANR